MTGGAGCSQLGGRGVRESFLGNGKSLPSPEECGGVRQVKGTCREVSWPGGGGEDGEEPHLPRKAGADQKIASAVQVVPSG